MRSIIRKLSGLGILMASVACGGGSDGTTPADVNTIAKNAGDGQSAVVGAAAPVAPSVRVTNQNAAPVAGIAVTFAVASGGGSVTGASTTTNAQGIATVGGWTMGTAVGPNTLTASSSGINGSPLTFSATANAGAPANLTKLAGDNQTASPAEFVAVKPSVKVTDQYGNPVAGVNVSFAVASGGGTVNGAGATTGVDGVATIGDWKLGPNQGANTLTATLIGIPVTGSPATFTATGQFVALSPTASTAITGDKTYSSVNIPAGVTLTITSDAAITVVGDYTQAGVVNAPCHTLTISAGGIFTATGNISNACTDPNADGNDLVLIGKGGYNISNNEIDSSGDIWIMDGPTLALPAVSVRPAVGRRASADVAEAGPYRCRLVNMKLKATPLTKKKGANGTPKGDDGKSGTSRTSGCGQLLTGQGGGNLLVDGITMTGGTGGDGGDGTSSTSTASLGGAGGEPGALNLVSDGDIDINGTVTLNLGNGGNGGNATSTVNAAGVSATATGGKGAGLKPRNFSSPVTIQSKRGTLAVNGTLIVNFGTGGAGGIATASGGAGAPGNPGQKGGDATANGGNGGDAEPWSMVTSGSVLVFGTVQVNGGAGGAGGLSKKTPGAGGAGNVPGATGGAGGNAFGTGGNGGRGQPASAVANVPPALANTVLQSPGGAAGGAEHSGAKGGDGVPLCPTGGGGGGKGGDASGGGGNRGVGVTNGALGTVTFTVGYGNGGNGKAGGGPAGPGGANSTSYGSGATGTPPAPNSFQPGLPGGPCPPAAVIASLTSMNLGDGPVAQGTYKANLTDPVNLSNVLGQIDVVAEVSPNFYGSSPARIGWGDQGSWLMDLKSAKVLGQQWTFTVFTACLLNTLVNATNPVFAEQLNNLKQVIQTTLITQLTCVNIQVLAAAWYIRFRGTGLGQFADMNGFGGTGAQSTGGAIRQP